MPQIEARHANQGSAQAEQQRISNGPVLKDWYPPHFEIPFFTPNLQAKHP